MGINHYTINEKVSKTRVVFVLVLDDVFLGNLKFEKR